MIGDPILVDCEGSACPVHHTPPFLGSGICSMCGQIVACYIDGTALDHQRDDVLARLDRGDFG